MGRVALDHQGLFRLSGHKDKVDQLKLNIDQGREFQWDAYSIDVIASTHKLYLRSLPEPLCTNVLYPRFITAASMTNTAMQLEYLSCLVHTLPSTHLDLLRFLLEFSQKVVAHSERNMMHAQNLSIIFGPLFFPTASDDAATYMAHAGLISALTEVLIVQFQTIFSVRHGWIWVCEGDADGGDGIRVPHLPCIL